MTPKLGRNDPCRCGSGKKYKACHLAADEAAERAAREKAAEQEPVAPTEGPAPAPAAPPPPRHATRQPWKRASQNTKGFQKFSAPRKVGGS